MLTERQKKMGEERLVQYFEKHPEDLEAVLRVIDIYTKSDARTELIEEILRGPFGESIARVTYEYRERTPYGLRKIIIDKKDPSKYKMNPYVALSVAEVGEWLREEELEEEQT